MCALYYPPVLGIDKFLPKDIFSALIANEQDAYWLANKKFRAKKL
jgi:hypothetical protein